jgi:hypothetical protein
LIKYVIIRKKHRRRKKQWISGLDFRTRRLKGGDPAGIAPRETEADVGEQTAVLKFVAPPKNGYLSFAIRSASLGDLVRE